MSKSQKLHRTRADQRWAPVQPLDQGDNIDRIATGVRVIGHREVHAAGTDGRPGCGIPLARPSSELIRTTHWVTCSAAGCATNV